MTADVLCIINQRKCAVSDTFYDLIIHLIFLASNEIKDYYSVTSICSFYLELAISNQCVVVSNVAILIHFCHNLCHLRAIYAPCVLIV